MTHSHADLLAECERLRDRVAELERCLAELENPDSPLPSDPVTYVMQRYPKRADEV